MKVLPVVLALAFGIASSPVVADPCAGFADVESTSVFCPSVEWQKNRGVTTGCGDGSTYCPSDAVSRLAMAAFMKRLGTALTPVPITAEESPGVLDLDVSPVVCTTTPFNVSGYPRRAYLDASVSGAASGDVDFGVAILASTDGGSTWDQLSNDVRGAVLAGRWGNTSGIAYTDIEVGESVTFGVRLVRADAGAANLSDSRCSVRVTLYSRDGATSPY